jgi:hypothetical protein
VEADDGQVGARREDPELVEDAVVGQVVLGVPGHHLAAVKDGGGVLRPALRDEHAGPLVRVALRGVGPVEVSDDHGELTEAVGVQVVRELCQRRPAGLDETGAQREVLDGVPGEHHLGEGSDVRTGVVRRRRPLPDQGGIAGEVAERGVDLGQREAQLRHASSVVSGGSGAG